MTTLIDFDGINHAAKAGARTLLQALIPGGKFRSLEYVVKNPTRNDREPGSFNINYRTGVWKDFATGDGGGDFVSLVAYLRGCGQGDAAHELAKRLGVPLYKTKGVGVDRSANVTVKPTTAAPKIHQWGDSGPPKRPDEVRRHPYSESGGQIVKIKIKKQDGSYTNCYRVSHGWLAQKPDNYIDVPYTTRGVDPFDPELKDDEIHWPEGENDVDTFARLNLPAFTFGGVGDGLTADVQSRLKEYVQGRQIVIHADNDEAGRKHAQHKAACAHAAGAVSTKIVEFRELPPKGDVTDYIAAGGTAEDLLCRADATPVWKPCEPEVSAHPAERYDDPAGSELIIRRMSDVQPEKIEWLWQGRIAIGKQTLIGGEPGLGKSQITAALAAAVTTEGQWPCNEGRAPKGSVLILSAEDDAADTIRPRLDAAGADASGVHLISAVSDIDGNGRRTFNLQADLPLLERAIKRIGDVRLVIIDPVSSYLGKTDSHKNADVRGTLEPLGDMASLLRVAVVSVTHFSKGTGQSAVNSFIGSIAFVAAARAAFIVTRDPESEDPARRLFVQAKNNLAMDSGGLAFRVEQRLLPGDIVASAVMWEGERITRTADEILAASRETDDKPERGEAEDFLKDVLAAGPRPATEVEAEAKGAGIAWRTVRRAQKDLGIKPYRRAESGDGLGNAGRWYWSLPGEVEGTKMAMSSYGGHVSDVATLKGFGRLRCGGDGEEFAR